MATVTSLGAGSGLDLEGIITKLMSVEQQPLTVLQQKEASFQAQLTAYGTLKGALSTLQTSAQTLTQSTTYTGTATALSDSSVLSASTGSSAAVGSYSISVGQLAQAQVLRSNSNFANTTDTFNLGTIAITVGGSAAVNVTIDSTNNTLAGIRDAINAANAGVSASIVNDGTTNRLLISSNTTGLTAGAIGVSVTDSGTGGANALSTLDGANLVQLQAPLDAQFSVNGLAITRPTNQISDVINGVTLNLTKAGTPASPISTQLTVSRNTSAIQASITAFVNSYNAAVNQMGSLSAYDATTNTASILTGDATLRSIQGRLQSLVTNVVSGVGGNVSRLSDIGISVQKDGTLGIDAAKLQTALSNSNIDLSKLFGSTATGNEGIAVNFNSTLDGFLNSTGVLANRTNGINQSVNDLKGQETALSDRLTVIENNYRAQFTALDTTIASMQQTQSYLTQQLSYLQSLATGVYGNSKSNN